MNQGQQSQGYEIPHELYRQYVTQLQQVGWNQPTNPNPNPVPNTPTDNPLFSIPGTAAPTSNSTELTPLVPPSQKNYKLGQVIGYTVWIIYVLCLVDIGFFVWEMVKNNKFESMSVNPMFGPSADTLLQLGAKWVPFILDGEYWRFISPIVLHGGLIHLVCNLSFQFFVGRGLERLMGWWRILILYILSGIGGNLVSSIFLPEMLEVGASGALFGLFGASFAQLILLWGAYNSPCKTLSLSLVSLIISLAMGLLPGLDNFAHIGGLLVGFPLGLALISTTEESIKISKMKSRYCGIFGILASLGVLAIGFVVFFVRSSSQDWCDWCKIFNCIDLSFIGGPNYCASPPEPPPAPPYNNTQ